MTMDNTDTSPQIFAPGLNRRDILKAGLTGMLGIFPLMALAAPAEARSYGLPSDGVYKISFSNEHTGENFYGAYRVGNKYIPESFDSINAMLRDYRTGDVFPIDPRAMDILYSLQQKTNGGRQAFEVLSGYRSPKTNAMLQRTTAGVARNSLHMTGQAVDLRLPNYSTRKLRDVAMNLRAGGVGYYPSSNFVHVDTGRVRHW